MNEETPQRTHFVTPIRYQIIDKDSGFCLVDSKSEEMDAQPADAFNNLIQVFTQFSSTMTKTIDIDFVTFAPTQKKKSHRVASASVVQFYSNELAKSLRRPRSSRGRNNADNSGQIMYLANCYAYLNVKKNSIRWKKGPNDSATAAESMMCLVVAALFPVRVKEAGRATVDATLEAFKTFLFDTTFKAAPRNAYSLAGIKNLMTEVEQRTVGDKPDYEGDQALSTARNKLQTEFLRGIALKPAPPAKKVATAVDADKVALHTIMVVNGAGLTLFNKPFAREVDDKVGPLLVAMMTFSQQVLGMTASFFRLSDTSVAVYQRDRTISIVSHDTRVSKTLGTLIARRVSDKFIEDYGRTLNAGGTIQKTEFAAFQYELVNTMRQCLEPVLDQFNAFLRDSFSDSEAFLVLEDDRVLPVTVDGLNVILIRTLYSRAHDMAEPLHATPRDMVMGDQDYVMLTRTVGRVVLAVSAYVPTKDKEAAVFEEFDRVALLVRHVYELIG
ncbi:hypothetical protein J8273_2796 [Carpediemonas membranifera]|uniref:Uncharacterized protein n=1 Tax=Carpediemonas membranifera TaxID=201153 RepID=A0A8J6BZJ7_9EUKA|nr:hypothetical protein J8273_2796 [Carpediemonas membranifera]|eukprot:KAG9395601.1 hypothetical protein J8273_2796 [Carpediemonas membranifera]